MDMKDVKGKAEAASGTAEPCCGHHGTTQNVGTTNQAANHALGRQPISPEHPGASDANIRPQHRGCCCRH